MYKHIIIASSILFFTTLSAWTQDSVHTWDKETVELFQSIPVQEGGRIKPLDTFAQFRLLKMNGKRTFTSSEGERISSIVWLMNCLLYPENANEYKCFMVDNSEVVASIGLTPHPERRGRYSYSEIAVKRDKLFELGRQYMKMESKQRTPMQNQIINLAENIFHFEQLTHFFDFAKASYHLHDTGSLVDKAFPNPAEIRLSSVIEQSQGIVEFLENPATQLSKIERKNEHEGLRFILDQASKNTAISKGIYLLPPLDETETIWLSPMDFLTKSTRFPTINKERLELLALLEDIPRVRDDKQALSTSVKDFHDATIQAAVNRGEYDKITLEVHYYKGKYLFYSQWLFVLTFIIIAFSWLNPQKVFCYKLAKWGILAPITLLIIGITIRCVIRERPPVTTLYETILFITACVTLIAWLMELVNKQRIALNVGAFMGVLGMFLAYRYEAKEAIDTMPSLIAVLDTNFWLTTHVTTVVAGYAAGLLAAGISHIYILGKLIGFKKQDKKFYLTITRMSYGVICFGLLFATVGTVLGGVWANDSWGRFWGWDPKENGALMIVLWMLFILHMRLGRHIRELGIHACSIILGMIVAFSWWGVNNLGVGLHAYGFTDGLWRNLGIFWAMEGVVFLFAFVLWIQGRQSSTAITKSNQVQPE